MKKEAKDIFKKHFSNHEYDVDPDQMWKAIQAKRKQKRRKPFWWLLGITGFLLITALYLINLYTLSSQSEYNIVSHNFKLDRDKKNNSTHLLKKFDDQTSLPTSTPENILDNFSSDKNIKQALTSKNVTYENESNSFYTDKNIRTDEQNNTYNTTHPVFANKNKIKNQQPKTGLSNVIAKQLLVKLDNDNPIALKKLQINIKQLPIFQTILKMTSIDIPDFQLPQLVPIQSPLSVSQKWSINLIAGIGHSNSSYIQTIEDNTRLTESLQTHIRPHVNKQLTALVKFKISERFKIATGLSYQISTDEFEWNKSYIEDFDGNFIRVIDDLEIDPLNSLIGSNSSAHSFVKVDRNIFNYNEFQTIELPFRIYYQVSKSKIGMSSFVGLHYNIWQSNSGYTLGNQLQVVDYKNSGYDFIITKQYVLGTEVSYLLNPKLKLFSEISVNTRQLVEQRYYRRDLNYQFNIGISLNLD